MKKHITLYDKDMADIRLRSIDQRDIEELRVWKNSNRSAFFYKQEISPEAQAQWYRKYLSGEDYIFMAEININDEWEKIGCLGFRVVEENVDLYNIMRGRRTEVRSSMRAAMLILLAHLTRKYDFPVKCDVLAENPAVEWYKKCGFLISEYRDNYYIMTYQSGTIALPDVEEEV